MFYLNAISRCNKLHKQKKKTETTINKQRSLKSNVAKENNLLGLNKTDI